MSQLILITFFPLTAMFGEMRTYLSKDGKKTFRGELIEYESSTKKAKMRITRGKVLTFPIEILSKQDQKYLEEQGPIVQAKKALSIDTKHYSKRIEKNKPAQGQWHFEKYAHNYIITVENNREEMLRDVTVEYLFFVEKNRRQYQNKIEKISSSDTIDLVLSNGIETIATKSAHLESWSDNPVMPTGGGGG
ncbi:MAG: hypothetical protein CMO76_10130 [Verrucomicrobiales bacterium]|nr:hypothetical protein [Verrucomicrobiales bacterium]